MLDIDTRNLKPPYFVHSDAFRTASNVRSKVRSPGVEGMLEAHMEFLAGAFGEENLILPTFNYDFGQEGRFSPEGDPSEVGAISNFCLKSDRFSRTHTPFYSCASLNRNYVSKYCNQSLYKPFSRDSVFGDVAALDGTLVYYGAPFSASTFIHYIEQVCGPPLYRYDKIFDGEVLFDDYAMSVSVEFHVRPQAMGLDYDWNWIWERLVQYGAVHQSSEAIFCIKARDFLQIVGDHVNANDLPLLDVHSRTSARDELDRVNRRFLISDFEG